MLNAFLIAARLDLQSQLWQVSHSNERMRHIIPENPQNVLICVDTIDMVEGVCNGFLALYTFFWFPEFSGYHQWQQESQ